MTYLSKEQRVFIVSRYLETKSYDAVFAGFAQRFLDRAVADNITKC